MNPFIDYLQRNRHVSTIQIYFDIETLQYNIDEGKKKPSAYKNVTYSFAFGYFDDQELIIHKYPSSKQFFDDVTIAFEQWKTKPKIQLIAHNTNKYDNIFMRYDLIYFYNCSVENIYLANATDEGNASAIKKKQVTPQEKQEGIILEKRIKSSNNLELNFFLKGVEFYTTDNYLKTNASIATLGHKLYNLGVISEQDLKTDFDYEKYNRNYDMTDNEAYAYAEKVFYSLSDEELLYIRNDIVILANSVKYYDKLFHGFDYSKITFTSNILEYYNDNDLTSYQLLKSVGKGKDKQHIKYTSYLFDNQNFYDYLKSFYGGGLNFYNDRKVGHILTEKIIAMDINSSYPHAMYNYKIPTYLHDYKEFNNSPEFVTIEPHNDDYYYLYRMSKEDFDTYIIERIQSRVIKQMLVKYYGKHDYININTYTIKLIETLTDLQIDELPLLSFVCFKCEYFGSRDKISEKYYVKTQGSSNKIIDYQDPYNIKVTDKENTEPFTREEIDISKVILNGLYGIPALRSHFNVFRWTGNDLVNVPNGYENNERNIAFSVFVTSVSLFNLLQPLSNLSQQEIDEHFIYCDTDSLYLNKEIEQRMPNELFHPDHLGYWGMDETDIQKMIVLNHKKYAYEVVENNQPKIVVKAGGVRGESFDTNQPFEDFVRKQFSNNCTVETTKAILNKQGTISIYPSKTVLQKGLPYRMYAYDPEHDQMLNEMFEEIRKTDTGNSEDYIYIESNLGTFSQSDIYPHEHEKTRKLPLKMLILAERMIQNKLSNN